MKLLRRSWHVVSILTLLAIIGCASLSKQQQRKPNNKTGERPDDPQPTFVAAAQQSQPNNQAHSTNHQSPHWYDFLMKPVAADWAIVIVAALTGLVVGWQAWETRKSADASRSSVEQADRHFRLMNPPQIDISDWSAEILPGDTDWLTVFYEIANPGPLAIDVLKVTSRVPASSFRNDKAIERKTLVKGGRESYAIRIQITEDWPHDRGWTFPIVVHAEFINELGQQGATDFRKYVLYNPPAPVVFMDRPKGRHQQATTKSQEPRS